jgi:hypothetical protein
METVEVRDRGGKLLTRFTISKNPSPEEVERGVEEIRRVGKLAQQH